jgi:drug/metabolite transporter (DMT)-like permease
MMYMIGATVLFSFGPVLIRMGINQGISPDHLMVLRLFIAAPLFFLAVMISGNRGDAKISKGDLPFLVILSVAGMGSAMFCFFRSIAYLGASVATIIGAITPATVMLFAYVLYSRPVTWRQIASMVISFFGVVLLIMPMVGLRGFGGIVRSSLVGVGYVLMANLCSSGAMLGFERYLRKKSPLTASFHVTGMMFLFYGVANGLPSLHFGAKTWVIVFLLGSVTWFIPFMLYFHGIKALGSSNAVLVQNAGPMVTVLAAGVLLGERLTMVQIAGMAIIMVSVYLLRVGGDAEKSSATAVKGIPPLP